MCCPAEADTGFFRNIKKIFTGMIRYQSPNKENVYTYSMSQLKNIEKEICILEEETYRHENTIKGAMCNDCVTDCQYLSSALNSIMDKLECIRCDLQRAHECYDPVRDRCENELICQLMDRTRCLEMLVSDLWQQACLLECQGNCWSVTSRRCKPGCRSPCFSLRACCPSPCGPPPCGPPPCAPCGPPPCGPCGPPLLQPLCEPDCRKPCCKPKCVPRCKPSYKNACGVGCGKPSCSPPVYKPRRYF